MATGSGFAAGDGVRLAAAAPVAAGLRLEAEAVREAVRRSLGFGLDAWDFAAPDFAASVFEAAGGAFICDGFLPAPAFEAALAVDGFAAAFAAARAGLAAAVGFAEGVFGTGADADGTAEVFCEADLLGSAVAAVFLALIAFAAGAALGSVAFADFPTEAAVILDSEAAGSADVAGAGVLAAFASLSCFT